MPFEARDSKFTLFESNHGLYNLMGVWKTRKSGSGTGTGIRNRNRNRNRKRNRNWRNKWMLQVGKYDSHQNSSSLLCIPRKVDDDTRNSFKKRYVYIEHSSYHSFQLNWVTQNIFAFVGHSNTEELVEMWIRVKNFWLLNLCKTKTLTL